MGEIQISPTRVRNERQKSTLPQGAFHFFFSAILNAADLLCHSERSEESLCKLMLSTIPVIQNAGDSRSEESGNAYDTPTLTASPLPSP